MDYFLRDDRVAARRLVADILDPRSRYELELPTPGDLARAVQLDSTFHGLGLGLVDGTVAAVAERRRVRRVLTIDRKHFSALRIGPRLDRTVEIVP